MRKVVRVAIVAGLMAGLAGCTTGGDPETDGSFTLVWGKETDPAGINPLTAGDVHSWEIFTLVYETLTQPNEDLTVGPGLAESWEQLDETTWRFVLREGVTFSNGSDLTSADVVGTWEALKELGARTASYPGVDTMEAVDDLTFDVTLNAPFPDLPNRLEAFWVLPGEELADGSFNPDEDLLGTGPYVSGEHVDGVSWTFEKNPDYWRDVDGPDQIDIRFIPDDASRIAAIRTGEVDLTMTSNPDVQAILAGDDTIEVTVQETTDLYYLWLNAGWSGSAVFDRSVRQAIALSIDRQQIIETALGGVGQLTGIVPRGLPDACDPAGVLGAEGTDIDQAKDLLEDAGATDLSMRLTVVPAFGALRAPQIAQVIQQNLQEIGISVEVVTLDGGAWLDEVITTSQFDATVNWFTGGGTSAQLASYFDPERVAFFASIVEPNGAYLEPLRAALATPIGDDRTEALSEACDALNEAAFFIPLASKPTVILTRTDRIEASFPSIEPIQMTFRRISEFSSAQ